MHKAVLEFGFKSNREVDAFEFALSGECEEKPRFRSEISVSENTLSILIEASDPTSLRAVTNSFLRYVQMLESLSCLR